MRVTITKKNFLITFTTAFPSVIFYSATVTSTATSGTFTGMKLVVNASGIGANLDGLVVEAHSQALTTGLSWVNGAKIVAECDSGKYVSLYLMGLYLQVYAYADSVVANVCGLYIDYGILHAVAGTSTMIYFRNNSPTHHPGSYMTMYGGADYFIYFNSSVQGGAMVTGDVTGTSKSHCLKCDHFGTDRYIQLYVGPPA